MEPGQRKIMYIAISAFCVLAIIAAVVEQFTLSKNGNTNVNAIEEEEITQVELRQEFNAMFDNKIHYNNYDTSSIEKRVISEDIVYSAYDIEESQENKYEVDIHLPVININNEIASSFNSITQEVFANKATEVLNNESGNTIIYSVNYTGFVSGDVLSVVIKSTLKEPSNAQRVIVKTYNYNLKTKLEVSIFDAIIKKGTTQEVVKDKIKIQIVNSIKESKYIEASGYGTYVRDVESSIYDIKNVSEFFFKEDGTLYIIYAYGNNNYTSETDIIKI